MTLLITLYMPRKLCHSRFSIFVNEAAVGAHSAVRHALDTNVSPKDKVINLLNPSPDPPHHLYHILQTTRKHSQTGNGSEKELTDYLD